MLLKLSKWCEILAFKLRQKSLYFELKHYIINNQSYFRKIRYWERNIGKTYSLVKLANKFKCPIAVRDEKSIIYIKRMCQNLNIKDMLILPCNNTIIGKRYDKILCEEGIDGNFINEVLKPMSKCLVGYLNVDTYSNKQKFQLEYQCNWIK